MTEAEKDYIMFKDCLIGNIEFKENMRLENGKIVLGAIVKRYAINGDLISQEQIDNIRVGWSDNSEITQKDATRLKLSSLLDIDLFRWWPA